MKHRVTRALFDYWDALRGARPAPDRCDIDPGAIRSCLASTFVLTCDAKHGHPFRIAGTSLCEMFGTELTRRPFDQLWTADDRPAMFDLLRTVTQDAGGTVADVIGQTAEAETVELEMILLPLASGDTGAGRILGALAASSAPYWLGTRPLQALHLGTCVTQAQAGTTRLRRAKDGSGAGFAAFPLRTAEFHEIGTANPPLTPLE